MNDNLYSLKEEPSFQSSLKKLCLDETLTSNEAEYLLACAIVILRYYQSDKRRKSYLSISYFIILKYSTKTGDYKPLYDFSIDTGFYPVSRFILQNDLLPELSLKDIIVDETLVIDFTNKLGGYVETFEQRKAVLNVLNTPAKQRSFIAPTSFGKSSVVIDLLKLRLSETLKAVIIVPTKSLLIQTYRAVKQAELGIKLLMHDEMYNGDSSFIAIFTQERASRLLTKNKVHFDIIVIDEAHNILDNDSRSILLSRVIKINEIRNPKQELVYLSPLVENVNNLNPLEGSEEITAFTISHNVKEPQIFFNDASGNHSYYNRFLREFYPLNSKTSFYDYILKNSNHKNFIFNNRPIIIEKIAEELYFSITNIEITTELSKLINLIKSEVHEEFYEVKYLKKGIVYLHAKIPNQIKEFLEYKFSQLSDLRFLIANTVILEGINLPIDTLFISNTYGLDGKALINLVGRVNRLNNVFVEGSNNLKGLLPNIHFVENAEFSKGKMAEKIELLSPIPIKDKVSNPTLNNFDLDRIEKGKKEDLKKKVKRILEEEKFVLGDFPDPKLEFKKYLIGSGISIFYKNVDDILERLTERVIRIQRNSQLKIEGNSWNELKLIEKIYYFFVYSIETNVADFEIERLKNEHARNFYHYYLTIGLKTPLKDNIKSFVDHFEKKALSADPLIFTGSTYGTTYRVLEPEKYNTSKKVYINLAGRKHDFLVNLAIVKIKIEEDFIGYKLNKLIYLLSDYRLISQEEFNSYIYGTNDSKTIELTKYGLSINVINKLIKDNQLNNLVLDKANTLVANQAFSQYLEGENELFQFELKKYL